MTLLENPAGVESPFDRILEDVLRIEPVLARHRVSEIQASSILKEVGSVCNQDEQLIEVIV